MGLLGWLVQSPFRVDGEERIRSAAELKGLSLEELVDQKVVLVSREAQSLSGAPSAVVVIDSEQIRRSGATSLPEALRLAPNLQVAQVGSSEWAISARGFNNTLANKMLVMIDGRTVYTPLFAGVFWDAQDTLLEDVDHIEVVSGPGASLWGANAVNGVINVVTKGAQDTQGGLLMGGGGTELTGLAGARYGGRLGTNVYYRVYGQYVDRDRTRFADGRQATNDWSVGRGGFRVDWEAQGENWVTAQGDYYNGDVAQPQSQHREMSGGNLLSRWTHGFSDDSDLRLQVYYDRTSRFIPDTFQEDLDTLDGDVQHRFSLGDRHHVMWGLGYRVFWDHVDNSPAVAFLPDDLSQQVYSAFLQDRIAIVEDRLALTVGSKLEHNDYTGIEVQPNLRLAWTPDRRQTVWTAVSRAVRTPSRIDRDLYVPGVPPYALVRGASGFQSEELVAYELGYRIQPTPTVGIALTGFYHDYDRLRSFEPIDRNVPFPVVVANGLQGETYGAELVAEVQATEGWRLRAGYTELQVHIRPRPGSLDTSRGSGESHDANHHFTLWSMWDLPAGFELDTGFRYVTSIANQDVPAYGEADVRLGWRPRSDLEFSVVGQNLIHAQHPEFGAPGLRYEIERSVYGKVIWRF